MKKKWVTLGIISSSLIVGLIVCVNIKTKNQYSDKIKETLIQSGKNKNELEKVLNHFKYDQKKYKAAQFLIANMGVHKTNNKIKFLNSNHKEALDLLNGTAREQYFLGFGKVKQKQEFWDKNKIIKEKLDSLIKNIAVRNISQTKEDVKEIKSQWLINHINQAFKKWEKSKFIADDFNEFSETFLAYRYANESLNTPFDYPKQIWKDLLKNTDLNDTKAVINELRGYFSRINKMTVNFKNKNNLGFYNIVKWKNITCDEQIVIAANILNDIGIPTRLDYTPLWFHRTLAHSWCVAKDSIGNYSPFSPFWQSIDSTENIGVNNKNYFKRVSKVFRRTFAIQEKSAVNYKKENESIPPFFKSKNWIDVTDSYHKTASITIKIKGFNYDNANLVYLAVFTPNGWYPIDWSVANLKNKEATFTKVPVKGVYNIVSFTKGKTTPVSTAFYLNSKEKVVIIEPDHQSLTSIKVLEKYPPKERLFDFRREKVNSKFQGSNNKNFKEAKDLYVFSNTPSNYIESVPVTINDKFRYVRFKPQDKVNSNIAIMEFYNNQKKKTKTTKGVLPYIFNEKDTLLLNNNMFKLEGKPISNNRNASLERLHKIFDGNMETYCTDKWVGLDLGKPKKIQEIRYAFRNANNRINIGDIYQLFYYDKGWVYYGVKRATYNFLQFKNVPSGTMYWLKNITKGKEELPFMYYKGNQLFVNYDNLEKLY